MSIHKILTSGSIIEILFSESRSSMMWKTSLAKYSWTPPRTPEPLLINSLEDPGTPTIHESMVRKYIANADDLNPASCAALIFMSLLTCSYGDSRFIPTTTVPAGTISVHCYPIPCRSAVDVAVKCDRVSTCWGLPDVVYPGYNCSICTCPADPATLNDVNIAHYKEIYIIPFLKGNE